MSGFRHSEDRGELVMLADLKPGTQLPPEVGLAPPTLKETLLAVDAPERPARLRPAGDRGGPRDMIEEQTPPGLVDSEMGPTRSGGRTFNQWLQVQVRARKLTQRQLAQKSGVDHSTISRLMRGDRTPSLRTAALLARGLGMAEGLDWPDRQSLGETASPAARVEHALRLDELLSETQVRELMNVYLATRLRRPRSVATPAPVETTGTTPVPIVLQVSGGRPPSTFLGRLPNAARGRSS